MRWNTTFASAALVLTAALLTGCTTTSTGVATVTSTPTATTTAARGSSAPPRSPTPASTATTAATSTSGSGCPATGGSIPVGAQVQQAGDLDRDGKPDQEFIHQDTFGVRTGSGAVITFTAGLAGGGDRHGWISTMEAEPPMAVMDDGRGAVTRAFVDCAFVTPEGVNGKPYEFAIGAAPGYGSGTGISCVGSDRGGYTLAGVDAVKVGGGRYRIDTTLVDVSKSGTTAKNADTVRGTRTYPAHSQTVADAERSFCKLVPLLDAGGK